MSYARTVALLSIVLCLALPTDVRAQETRAQELYDTAVRAAREGDWSRSADLFEEAWRLGRDPILLYNAAFSRAMLGHFAAAIERSQRAEDEGLTGETRWVNLGRNRAWRSVRRAQMVADAPRTSLVETGAESPADRPRSSSVPWLAWTFTGLGAAAVGTGLGIDLSLADEREEFERARANSDVERARQIAEQTRGRRTTAQIFYIGGAAVGVAGIAWLIVRAVNEEPSQTRIIATPNGVFVRW